LTFCCFILQLQVRDKAGLCANVADYSELTFSFALNLLGVSVFSSRLLLVLLTLSTLVKVLDDDSDEHVKHKESDEQQERDEVGQTPLVVVRLRLRSQQQQL